MFVPFVDDSIDKLESNDFTLDDLRTSIRVRHKLEIPTHTLDILLSRMWKRGFVAREGGRYFRKAPRSSIDLAERREKKEREQGVLATYFRNYALSHGVTLTSDDALALIMEFLEHFHVYLLLGEEEPFQTLSEPSGQRSRLRLVARFIERLRAEQGPLLTILRESLEGFILQNALLLKDINAGTKSFSQLEVFFDTGFLFDALGLTGSFSQRAARETFDLLRATKAQLSVFRRTIGEMQRILKVHEHHLGTQEGIEQLYPTELSRFLISHRYTPSDVKELSALLASQVGQLGLAIKDYPPHDSRFTSDEKKLTEVLKRPGNRESEVEPRVVHDVDCIAAVLTLRRGRTSSTLDEARAIFATTSGLVVKNVGSWYFGGGDVGISPIVHVLALSNAAWLKKPFAATTLKLDELCALCSAALSPTRKTWNQFLAHLRKLRESGEITSDESVALVASSLTDSLLSRIEDDMYVNAETLQEVVERVKQDYFRQASAGFEEKESRIRTERDIALSEARTAMTKLTNEEELRRRIELRLSGRAEAMAKLIMWLPFGFFVLLAAGGIVLSLPGLFPDSGKWKIVGWICVSAAAILALVTLIWRGHVQDLRREMQLRLAQLLRRWILGDIT